MGALLQWLLAAATLLLGLMQPPRVHACKARQLPGGAIPFL